MRDPKLRDLTLEQKQELLNKKFNKKLSRSTIHKI
jgi:hypothetical protein